jgi:hypothetical protein
MPRSIARARSDFFTRAGFASDGGYQDLVAEAEFAGLPYQVHNGPMRREALRIHDLHHLVTGFATDWKGEAEISAWELGSGGGGRHLYAWNIALWGLFTGLLAIPTRTWRAFQQGRMRSNLYVADVDVDALLPEPEQALQALTQGRANWLPDAAIFGLFSLLALTWGVLASLVVPLFALRSALTRACSCPMACGSMALS